MFGSKYRLNERRGVLKTLVLDKKESDCIRLLNVI